MFWDDQISLKQGPLPVLLKRGALTDTKRTNDDGSPREVPFKIIYPNFEKRAEMTPDQATDKCPLVIWSHGYGGSQNGASFLARFLASYGYIIVLPTHIGTDSSIWEGKEGHAWDILVKHHVSRATTLNRYRDISFLLDNLPSWMNDYPDLAANTDMSKLGMSGHSFGAITTQIMAGQLTPDENGTLINLAEPRFTAAIAYSPVPGTSHLSGDSHEDNQAVNIYETIKTPLLHMTGTDDSSPVNDLPYQDRLQIYEKSGSVPKALLVKQGGDHMVYNGTRGKLSENPDKERHEEQIKIISLAWWDYWLKGNQNAYDWLTGHGISQYIGNHAEWAIDL